MGKYLPWGLKFALHGCLGAVLAGGVATFADTPSNSLYSGQCCRPNARNFGYYETQWREWPCDQRPERRFPGAVGNEVIPPPAGQPQAPLPRASALPSGPETPGATTEKPGQPGQTTLPGEGTQLPGEGTQLPTGGTRLPGEVTPLPGEERPAEGPRKPAGKPAGKPAESPQPTAPKPTPKQPGLEGSLPGLEPESPVPPAAKEGPVTPLPSGGKKQAPAPSPAAPAKENSDVPAQPEIPEVPKAPLPSDGGLLPYQEPCQQSQVVQVSAVVPIEEGQPAMATRADWLGSLSAQGDPQRNLPAASPVAGVATETPVALEGYCPVALVEEEKWVRGDARWSVVCGGRTFLLSGPEQQQRFMAAASRYLPGFAGDDAVMAVDSGAHVAGKPEHSLFCGGKVYLFASAETLARFQQNPRRYVAGGR
ncbi:MAG: hypothetical protein ACLQLG_02905 [Thermoguttaceae bacterium]